MESPFTTGWAKAVKQTGASISVIFVPASNFLRAAIEALDNGIKLLVAIPEHVPVIDSLKLIEYAKLQNARIIGPNTPGIIVPEVPKSELCQPNRSEQVTWYYCPGVL